MQQPPETFPRRILVAVCGLSPQILTETLYALAVTGQPSFVPTEIHLLTTREGAHRASLTLLHPDSGKFHQLCRDYGLPGIVFDEGHIHVISNPEGDALDDIRSPQENEYLADHITLAIRQYTLDPQAALHVSMAGGRKTMGYYAGYALSLFGRPQDRLSHVLVTAEYEGNPNFFYPTPDCKVIYTRDNRPLDSAKAEVTLAQIPFIRLREDIPERLLNGQAGFSETIAFALRANETPHLLIDRTNREINANGLAIRLPDILLAFYFWVITRSILDERPMPKPDKGNEGNPEYAAEFLRHYQALADPMRDTDKTEAALRHGMDEAFFQEKVSRINTMLKKELGERLAKSFCIINRGRRGHSDYGLELSADQIRIV